MRQSRANASYPRRWPSCQAHELRNEVVEELILI